MRRKAALLSVIAILALLLAGCGGGMPENRVFSRADVAGRTVGVWKTSLATAILPDARAYETVEELAGALRYGSVDCVIIDSRLSGKVTRAQHGLRVLEEPYSPGEWRLAIAKENADLTAAANSVIETLTEDGSLEAIFEYYMTGKGAAPALPEGEYEHTITMAADSARYPWSYLDEDGAWAGIDVACAREICDGLGVGLEIVDVPHDELVDEVWYGRVQFAMGAMEKNEADLEKIDFSYPYLTSPQVIVVRKK